MTLTTPQPADEVTTGTAGDRFHRPLVLLSALIVAAWAVSYLACLVHAGAVLPVLLLVGTASLLRGGTTLLDRLMFAFGLLFGATCGLGLLFAVWPFGLDPVVISGTGLTVLIVVGVLGKRRPTLPRPRFTDLLSLGGAAVVAAFVAKPFLVSDQTRRLAILGRTEDVNRHFSVFDGIRHTGGYLFQDWSNSLNHVYEGLIAYPQGSHMVAAVLDGFLRSSATDYGSGLQAVNHYLGFFVVGYGLLALTMIWAVQWIASAGFSLGRRVVFIALVVVMCTASELFVLIQEGYPSEILGLALMVLLVAVLARPVPRIRQQLVLLTSLLVALGFTYYLFLPVAGFAVLVWLIAHRSRVRGHLVLLLTSAVVGGGLALFPMVQGVLVVNQGQALYAPGGFKPSRDLLLASICLVVAGIVGRRARRSSIWRSFRWSYLGAGILSVALFTAQGMNETAVPDGYYSNKSLHLIMVLTVLGFGSLLLYLREPVSRRAPFVRQLAAAVPGALVAVAFGAVFGLIVRDSPIRPAGHVWYTGAVGDMASARTVLREYHAREHERPVPTIFIQPDPYRSYLDTLQLAILQRTSGPVAHAQYVPMNYANPARPEQQIPAMTGPIRIIAGSPEKMVYALQLKARYADREIEVVRGF